MGIRGIQNPWVALPSTPPYVLPDDAEAIAQYNEDASERHQFELSLLPEPYFGSVSAPVVLLALNPGVSAEDFAVHGQFTFAATARRSMMHSTPFLHLQPGLMTPGARWWRRICKTIAARVGFDALTRGLLCLQFFPYHSRAFSSRPVSVPSQRYTFHLLRSAIAREAEVVVMRSWQLWLSAVPELERHPVHRVRNPRNPSLSVANLGAGFDALCRRLEADA